MRYYVRYIAKYLSISVLLVAFSLTAIVWLTQALRFIDFIVNRGVSALTFLQLTALMVPSLLFVVMPFALFVATLFTYNRLNSDSELVVLKSAGLSRMQLTKPILLVGGVAVIVAYFISLYALPVTYRKFKEMQIFLRDNYASMLLQEEVFNTPVRGLTVFIRERDSKGNLGGILVHDNRDANNPVTMMAQRGKLTQTESGPSFLLYNGNRQEMRDGRLSFLKFDSYNVDLSFYTQQSQKRRLRPEEFFILDLFAQAKKEPDRANELYAEAHHRITWPLYNMALALFAAAVLLSGQFNRRGQWRRIVGSVLVALAMVATGLSLQNIISRHVMLIPLLYINILFIFGISLWLLAGRNYTAIPAKPSENNNIK